MISRANYDHASGVVRHTSHRAWTTLLLTLWSCTASSDLAEASGVALFGKLELREGRCERGLDDPSERAEELERIAQTRWERAPFDLVEGPRAFLAQSQALDCYRLGQDREARARAERALAGMRSELVRRHDRDVLGLLLAQRADDPSGVARHAGRLLAILPNEPSHDEQRRARLKELLQRADASLSQVSDEEE